MCGITGFIDFNKQSDIEIVNAMVNTMYHRGPDNQAAKLFTNQNYTIGLGHARLAIIDLSNEANQPFSKHGIVLVYNGEIYNFNEIKLELQSIGYQFDTSSDTEVIIEAYKAWGLAFVDRFIGMFAFCLYDEHHEKILFCRDRLGVKPLFYSWMDGLFLFGSELKAIMAHPNFKKVIDYDGINYFIEYGYIPSPTTIFENTYKLEPGCFLKVNLSKKTIESVKYWDLKSYFEKPILDISYHDAVSETTNLIKSACNYRMVADVPVGVFLSGGYDSTCVTAMIQSERSSKLNTYTIGFPDGVNEAPHAEEIAKRLGTNHTTFDCTLEEAKALIADLPYYFDEPNADISCIPTILVSRLARKEVKVALSADGGDELFAGYTGYGKSIKSIQNLSSLYGSSGKLASKLLSLSNHLVPESQYWIKNKVEMYSHLLRLDTSNRIGAFTDLNQKVPSNLIKNLITKYKNISHTLFDTDTSSFNDKYNSLLYLDSVTTMPDLLLVKVDRASMSASLEAREPLLDHRLFEFAARLPMEYKYSQGIHKKILKDIVHQYIDPYLMERPKVGFDLPIYTWLRQDLKPLLDYYLSEEVVNKVGCFNSQTITELKKSFLEGTLRYPALIWRIITLHMWYEKWIMKSN